MLCGMKKPPTTKICVSERVILEQPYLGELLALIKTSGGVMRLPIDVKQLERWLMRQLRAEIAV